MDEVRAILDEIGLGCYSKTFEEEGWDDVDTVLSMTEEDIRTCISKPGHVRKLWLKLQRIIKEKGIQVEFSVAKSSPDCQVKTEKSNSSGVQIGTQTCDPALADIEEACIVNLSDLDHATRIQFDNLLHTSRTTEELKMHEVQVHTQDLKSSMSSKEFEDDKGSDNKANSENGRDNVTTGHDCSEDPPQKCKKIEEPAYEEITYQNESITAMEINNESLDNTDTTGPKMEGSIKEFNIDCHASTSVSNNDPVSVILDVQPYIEQRNTLSQDIVSHKVDVDTLRDEPEQKIVTDVSVYMCEDKIAISKDGTDINKPSDTFRNEIRDTSVVKPVNEVEHVKQTEGATNTTRSEMTKTSFLMTRNTIDPGNVDRQTSGSIVKPKDGINSNLERRKVKETNALTVAIPPSRNNHQELLPYNVLSGDNDIMACRGNSMMVPVHAVINNEEKQTTEIQRSLRVPTSCTVVKNSENVTIAKKVEVHHHEKQESPYDDQIKTIIKSINKKHGDLHVPTRAFQEAKHILEDRHWVVIAGNPGDGKTWMGHQLLLDYMSQSYEPIIVTSPDNWKNMVGGEKARKQIVFIDDIFGSVNMDDRKVSDWMSHLENIETLLKERDGELLCVCTTRKLIWEDVKTMVSKYKGFETMRLLDMSLSLYELTYDEKVQLVTTYGHHYSININTDFLKNGMKTTHGFPHCVELYSTNKYLRGQGEERFFSCPLELLEKDINILYESHPGMFCVLAMLVVSEKSGHTISIHDTNENLIPLVNKVSSILDQAPSLGTIRKCINKMDGIYIEQNEWGEISFKHPSFNEIVSFVIAKKNATMALDMLDIMSLVKLTKCCKYRKYMNETVVILSETYHEPLARCLTEYMLAGSRFAFAHNAFCCSNFLSVWMKYISDTRSEKGLTILEKIFETQCEIVYWEQMWLGQACNFIFCNVSAMSLETLVPLLIQSKLLTKYWRTENGIHQLSHGLVRASMANVSTSVIRLLLQAGADIHHVLTDVDLDDEIEKTAIDEAVSNANMQKIEFFISNDTCPFKTIFNQCDILYLAYKTGDRTIVQLIKQYLLAFECHLPNVSKGQKTVAHHLYGEKYYNLMQRNVAETYSHAPLYGKALELACNVENIHSAELKNIKFKERNTCVFENWFNSLHASPISFMSDLQFWLDNGYDINYKSPKTGRTILHRVVELGLQDEIKILLDSGADSNISDTHGKIPLFDALHKLSDPTILRLLLAHSNVSGIIDRKGRNALHYLCFSEEKECKTVLELAEKLVNADCNINKIDSKGRAPLSLGGYRTIKLFIENSHILGIDFKRCADLILHLIRRSETDVISKTKFLIDNGFQVTELDKRKRNIVHTVVKSRYPSQTKIQLIEFVRQIGTIDINARDAQSNTPLMLACSQSVIDISIVVFLLANGAKLEDKNKDNLSALHACISNGVDLKLLLDKEMPISNDILKFAITQVESVDNLFTLVKAGNFDISAVLKVLQATYVENRLMSFHEIIILILRVFSDNWLEIIEEYEYDNVRSLIVRSGQYLSKFMEQGLQLSVVVRKCIPLSWLPCKDEDSAVFIEELVKHGVDVDSLFVNDMGENCIYIQLAKQGFIGTLLCFLKGQRNGIQMPDEVFSRDMLNHVLTSTSNDTLIAGVLENLLNVKRFQTCLIENASLALQYCVDRVPLKVNCADVILLFMKPILFDQRNTLLHTVIQSIYVSNLLVNMPDHPWTSNYELCKQLLMFVKVLSKYNMLIQTQDSEGKTPLMVVLGLDRAFDFQKCIHVLVEQSESFQETDKDGKNILHYLASANIDPIFRNMMMKSILAKGATSTHDVIGHLPADYLCLTPDTMATLKGLLELNKDNKLHGINLLVKSILETDHMVEDSLIKIIQVIIPDCKYVYDITGVTLLAQSSRALKAKLVTYLLGVGANVDQIDIIGQAALHKLFLSECIMSLSWMKDFCFSETSEKMTTPNSLLYIRVPYWLPATRDWDNNFVEGQGYLMQRKQAHATLLQYVNTALDILYQLLEAGADPNMMDHFGRSPLHYCAGAYIPDSFVCPALKMLLVYGADVNLEDYKGITPLMTIAKYVHTKYRRMNILIEAGAKVDAKDYSGNGIPYYTNRYVQRRVAIHHNIADFEKKLNEGKLKK